MFCIERAKDSTIECCKARLVSKGFHLCLGLNYHDTFSHVVKHTTVSLRFLEVGPYARLILIMLFSMGHFMRTFICHNLLASLTLIILIIFANSQKLFMVSNRLLRLGTLNYALTFFTWASLQRNLILLFLFFWEGDFHAYLLVYVDDIIFIGSDSHRVVR